MKMDDQPAYAVVSQRVTDAMVALAYCPCWIPMPKVGEKEPILRDLFGSMGICSTEHASFFLRLRGFSDTEIEAAIREHLKWRRLECVSGGAHSRPTLHAKQSLWTWLSNKQQLSSRVIVNTTSEVVIVDGETYQLPNRSQVLFLEAVVSSNGAWISQKEIWKKQSDLGNIDSVPFLL
jgi:hypothetical protein